MFDDELDDEGSSTEGPLPPDDRLWRHPSEVGAALQTRPPVPASAPSRLWLLALVAGLTGAAVAVTTMAVTGQLTPRVVERQTAIQPVSDSTPADSPAPKTIRRIVTDTAAVVAQIEVVTGSRRRTGSGLVVRADGVLVTSAALVEGADEVTVDLADGRSRPGTVVGSDDATGLAVVRVDVAGLTVATTTSAAPQPGDPAVVVAGPPARGERPWVSPGVVSSVNRQAEGAHHTLSGLIETNNPVPASADGGALLAEDGHVTGVSLTLRDPDDAGSGYAVPIAVAQSMVRDLLTYGRVRQAWLGVEGEALPAAKARALDISGGALLTGVSATSPAATAGLQVGDVVLSVDQHPVESMDDLISMLPAHRPGQRVSLVVLRGTARTTCDVVLGERP